jgi:5-methylcytosine-specific restriction endonuclease McrA
MGKPRPPLSKELQLRIFRRDKWLCRWCDRPVIFGAAMRLLDREMKNADWKGKLAYYHTHATRADAPLLDELWAVIDHVKPVSGGGLNSDENLATACNKCNGRKNSAPLDDWGKRLIRKPIKGKYGPPLHWDGLSSLFVMLATRNQIGLSASEKAWLKVLIAETSAQ